MCVDVCKRACVCVWVDVKGREVCIEKLECLDMRVCVCVCVKLFTLQRQREVRGGGGG